MTKKEETKSILTTLANKYEMDRAQFYNVIQKTVMPAKGGVSQEQLISFLSVANEYNLNPLTREIYAFPARGGGITPMISIDGWLQMINRHPQYNGHQTVDNREDGKLISITVKMHRKDREYPTEITEYMDECKRNTEPWKQSPARMLRHKATIQAARYAFSFSGVYDEDEAERINGAKAAEAEVVVDKGVEGIKEKLKQKQKAEAPEVEAEEIDPETGEIIGSEKELEPVTPSQIDDAF